MLHYYLSPSLTLAYDITFSGGVYLIAWPYRCDDAIDYMNIMCHVIPCASFTAFTNDSPTARYEQDPLRPSVLISNSGPFPRNNVLQFVRS